MALIDNLISWWKLEEASGTAFDAHGANNLTAVNNPVSATGQVGDGRAFASTSLQRLVINDNGSFSWPAGFTVTLWAKIDTDGVHSMLVSKCSGSGSDREFAVFFNQANDCISVDTANTDASFGNRVSTANGSVVIGQWYFIMVRWTGSKIQVSIDNGTIAEATLATFHDDGTAQFMVGGWGINTLYCNGTIDEPALWGRALTDDEVAYLYNGGTGRTYEDIASISGTLSKTLGALTLSGLAFHARLGTLSQSLGTLTASATGTAGFVLPTSNIAGKLSRPLGAKFGSQRLTAGFERQSLTAGF